MSETLDDIIIEIVQAAMDMGDLEVFEELPGVSRKQWIEDYKPRILAAVEPKPAPVYEHAVQRLSDGNLADVVQQWSDGGWELVTMTYRLIIPLAGGYSGEYVCIFRREKSPAVERG